MEALNFLYMLFAVVFLSSVSAENCKDADTRCEGWAKVGECTKNPTWMATNCRKSCNKCEDEQCKDKSTEADCKFWKARHYCPKSSKWYSFMKDNCQKTCEFCGKKSAGLCVTNNLSQFSFQGRSRHSGGLTCL